jgi:hypothetical protein
MEREDDPRYPRSTKDDLLNEGRGVEDPKTDRPATDDDERATEDTGAGVGALGGAGVGMAVGGPSGALGGGAAGALATDAGAGDKTEDELEAERQQEDREPDR